MATVELVITLMRDHVVALRDGRGENLVVLLGRLAPGIEVLSGNPKYSLRVRATLEQQLLLKQHAAGMYHIDSPKPIDLFAGPTAARRRRTG